MSIRMVMPDDCTMRSLARCEVARRACGKQLLVSLWRPVSATQGILRLIAAGSVGLIMAWALLADGLPRGIDSAFHLYRLVERNHLIHSGVLLSRWSPDLGYGYGLPLYNYYPPLLYYIAELFVIVGLGPLVALQVTLAISLVSTALGMGCWVGGLHGAIAGGVAAFTFVTAPYYIYTLAFRAGFAEILALAWMPWGYLALWLYAGGRNTGHGLLCAMCLAAVIASHLFSGLVYLGTLLVYAMILSMATKDSRSTRRAVLFWPLLLGLGLAAVVWMPAILELNLIQIDRVLRIADPASGAGLISLRGVFVAPAWLQSHNDSALPLPRLSLVVAMLALVGAITGLIALRSHVLRAHVATAAIVTCAAIAMLTTGAWIVWDTIPFLNLSHLPFRFLGVGALWMSLLAGAGVAALQSLAQVSKRWIQTVMLLLLVGLAFMTGQYVFRLALPIYPPETAVDMAAALSYERTSRAMGLLMESEYLPRSVREEPAPALGPRPGDARLSEDSYSGEAVVLSANYHPLRYTLTIDSPAPYRAVFRTFYFPGWRAEVDGDPMPITPTDDFGLISVHVPAGQHQIQIRFGSTPVRSLALLLSAASLVMVLALTIHSRRAAKDFRVGQLCLLTGVQRAMLLEEET